MKKAVVLVFVFFIIPVLWAQNQNTAPNGFVLINGGTFTMGSPADEEGREADKEIQHQVTLGSFYMAKNPVTQKEYQELIGNNPSNIKGEDLPVESVSWYRAIEYCNALSKKEGLAPVYTIEGSGDSRPVKWDRSANGYRLPTDAEWEYACRAGTTTIFYTGNTITTNQANFNGFLPYGKNPDGERRRKTMPVGSFEPNAWGLYDMHGNVFEWCWDWTGNLSAEAQTDPAGAAEGSRRVTRGGDFDSSAKNIRSAYRWSGIPSGTDPFTGFRLVKGN